MVKVFGVSIDRFDKKLINTLEDEYTTYFKTKVYHIIAGIFPPEDLQELITSGRQVLILGYKIGEELSAIHPSMILRSGKRL